MFIGKGSVDKTTANAYIRTHDLTTVEALGEWVSWETFCS